MPGPASSPLLTRVCQVGTRRQRAMSPGKRRSKARVCEEEKRGLRGRVHGEEGGAANLAPKQRPPELLALLGLQRTAELWPRARELGASRRCSGEWLCGATLPGPYEEPQHFSGKNVAVPKTTQSNTSNNNVL